MRTTRTRQLLALCVTVFAVVMIGATPVAADVDCTDLKSRSAAQSYFEGRPGDLDGLDADGDGQACEANDPHSYGEWALPGLAALLLGALVVNGVFARRQARTRVDHSLPLQPPVPVQRSGERSAQPSTEQPATGILAAPGGKDALLEAAPDGSLDDLARALRLVPAGRRMSLVELYAVAHQATPQAVLDALVAEVSDVGLKRWASAGYLKTGPQTFGARSGPSGSSSPTIGPVSER